MSDCAVCDEPLLSTKFFTRDDEAVHPYCDPSAECACIGCNLIHAGGCG